ncbi:hypothetical protein OVS_02865 [Mycoplasma ovis str. Michigan]|uniref:Uncharacterized protein n=1 Tax=Mycoplasma ovis str. Michigan TaxID=1415773 RepID=A0ABN4BR57_9MOLU|nr:sigma-70 family RNA polymerase sigma factor [Mycoplasma ovis]AHC40368.1 hypothetical protein OVS_02865 [Mycoplasma ovis str. Michigan]
MNNITLTEESLVRDSIKKFQLNRDRVAFNLLLEKYYKKSCSYAIRFLSRNAYSSMMHLCVEEIKSYVFWAFWRAVQNYNLEESSFPTFKNYLYQLIRFDTLKELKKNFKGQCISKVDLQWYADTSRKKVKNSFDFCIDLDLQDGSQEISKFLESKNSLYPSIWQMKVEDIKNEEICEKLNITMTELRSRWHYIKRLVLEKFAYMGVAL